MRKDKNNKHHGLTLEGALCYTLSPVNAISATKLGVDHNDATLNIKTFSSFSILTQIIGESSMVFNYGNYNLPKLNTISSFDPLDCVTTHLK